MKGKIFVERLDDGVTIECKPEIEDIVRIIIEEYRANDVCIGEFLNTIAVNNISIEDIAIIYAKVYKEVEGDKVLRVAEGFEIDLATEYDNC